MGLFHHYVLFNMKLISQTSKSIQHSIQSRPRCSFCSNSYAAVYVQMKLNPDPKPYCLLHYYTTRACRVDTKNVKSIEAELNNQLANIRELFSEVYEELREEILNEALLEMDPLSILKKI